jgi:predicted nuclease with TOPRIM domain
MSFVTAKNEELTKEKNKFKQDESVLNDKLRIQVDNIQQLQEKLTEAQKLVSADKETLFRQNLNYKSSVKKALEIIDKPLVFFFGKDKVLILLKGEP